MELTDQRDIAAPPEAVWAALIDADVLKQCIPGCQEMTGDPDDGYEAVVTQKVGPVKATFKGAVSLSNVVEGQSCTISGEGKGGPAGFAKGGADVVLTPTGEGTRLSYDVNAKVGGKLAQLGSRVIDGFAKKMADQFFDNFKSVVEGGPADEAKPEPAKAAQEEATSEEAAASAEPGEKKGWFKRLLG
jgi:carbon monoxide dehydrogenase subunit G